MISVSCYKILLIIELGKEIVMILLLK
jgi:hypothetical protein